MYGAANRSWDRRTRLLARKPVERDIGAFDAEGKRPHEFEINLARESAAPERRRNVLVADATVAARSADRIDSGRKPRALAEDHFQFDQPTRAKRRRLIAHTT